MSVLWDCYIHSGDKKTETYRSLGDYPSAEGKELGRRPILWFGNPVFPLLASSTFHVPIGPCSNNTAATPKSGSQSGNIPASMGTGFKTNMVASAGVLPAGSALGTLEVTEAGMYLCSYLRHK